MDDVNLCIRILESMFVFVAEFFGVKLLMFGSSVPKKLI